MLSSANSSFDPLFELGLFLCRSLAKTNGRLVFMSYGMERRLFCNGENVYRNLHVLKKLSSATGCVVSLFNRRLNLGF